MFGFFESFNPDKFKPYLKQAVHVSSKPYLRTITIIPTTAPPLPRPSPPPQPHCHHQRFAIVKNKKTNLIKADKREIAGLLANVPCKEEKARIRVEKVI